MSVTTGDERTGERHTTRMGVSTVGVWKLTRGVTASSASVTLVDRQGRSSTFEVLRGAEPSR